MLLVRSPVTVTPSKVLLVLIFSVLPDRVKVTPGELKVYPDRTPFVSVTLPSYLPVEKLYFRVSFFAEAKD